MSDFDRRCTELGVTRPESAILNTLHYGITSPPSELPHHAAAEDYNPRGPTVTEDDCRAALANCLAKGWGRVVDEPTRTRLAAELRRGGVLGPISGDLPEPGGVDFTEAGADLWNRLVERERPHTFAYTDVVHEKTAWFGRTPAAAAAMVEELRSWGGVIAVTGPTAVGPWRAQWWRRFPEGYRVDVEQRRGPWRGEAESCYLDHSARNTDKTRLRDTLDRHNVTPAEWLVLEWMDGASTSDTATQICRLAPATAHRLLGIEVSGEQCREGLEACLRNGWVRTTDSRTVTEVQSLLRDDPAVLALPRTATGRPPECHYIADPLRPRELLPQPAPDWYWWGRIDFAPAGAALYRAIVAAWLGPDWEDDLRVSRVYFWEEHHYCESDVGFERIAQEHLAKGTLVQAKRSVPIGPWCVRWWDRFPAGYRLELELAEP